MSSRLTEGQRIAAWWDAHPDFTSEQLAEEIDAIIEHAKPDFEIIPDEEMSDDNPVGDAYAKGYADGYKAKTLALEKAATDQPRNIGAFGPSSTTVQVSHNIGFLGKPTNLQPEERGAENVTGAHDPGAERTGQPDMRHPRACAKCNIWLIPGIVKCPECGEDAPIIYGSSITDQPVGLPVVTVQALAEALVNADTDDHGSEDWRHYRHMAEAVMAVLPPSAAVGIEAAALAIEELFDSQSDEPAIGVDEREMARACAKAWGLNYVY